MQIVHGKKNSATKYTNYSLDFTNFTLNGNPILVKFNVLKSNIKMWEVCKIIYSMKSTLVTEFLTSQASNVLNDKKSAIFLGFKTPWLETITHIAPFNLDFICKIYITFHWNPNVASPFHLEKWNIVLPLRVAYQKAGSSKKNLMEILLTCIKEPFGTR